MRRVLPVLLLVASTAAAHPLGRQEHSLRVGLEVGDDGLHAVIVGEVPLAVAIAELGRRAGGTRPTPEQVATYTAERQKDLGDGASLSVDGKPVALTWTIADSAINGRAVDGFFVYVVEARLTPDQLDEDVTVTLANTAWSEVSTVYASQVRALPGWSVASTDAPDDWTPDDRARTLTARFTKP